MLRPETDGTYGGDEEADQNQDDHDHNHELDQSKRTPVVLRRRRGFWRPFLHF
jgi:hypothetical protein